jgi:photosystem II stability/assembly factor-like uncharacterized protein
MRKICTVLLCLALLSGCASKRPAGSRNGPSSAAMRGICVMDRVTFSGVNTACVVTCKGDLKLSHDGGVTWDDSSGEPYGTFQASTFIDDLNGWAVVGEEKGKAKLLRTVDGGKAWDQTIDLQEPQEHHQRKVVPSSIKFIDHFHGWVFDPFSICRTQDGGLTWADSRDRFHGFARDFHFATSDRGWVCSGNGLLYRTTDAGETWEQSSLPGEGDLNGIFFVDDSQGWVLGSTPSTVYLTSNGGATWSQVNACPKQLSLACLYFINQMEGWAAGGEGHQNLDGTYTFLKGTLLHSVDGGSTWTELPCPVTDGYSHVYFGDSSHGWLVGERTLYRSNDGGLSWQAVLKLERSEIPGDNASQTGNPGDR